MCMMKDLTAVKGISDAKAEKMIAAARDVCTLGSFRTGNEALKLRSNIYRISTGCVAFDELLGGDLRQSRGRL